MLYCELIKESSAKTFPQLYTLSLSSGLIQTALKSSRKKVFGQLLRITSISKLWKWERYSWSWSHKRKAQPREILKRKSIDSPRLNPKSLVGSNWTLKRQKSLTDILFLLQRTSSVSGWCKREQSSLNIVVALVVTEQDPWRRNESTFKSDWSPVAHSWTLWIKRRGWMRLFKCINV